MPLVTFGLSVVFYENSLLQKAGNFCARIDAWQGICFWRAGIFETLRQKLFGPETKRRTRNQEKVVG
jgi:hypothetical protein